MSINFNVYTDPSTNKACTPFPGSDNLLVSGLANTSAKVPFTCPQDQVMYQTYDAKLTSFGQNQLPAAYFCAKPGSVQLNNDPMARMAMASLWNPPSQLAKPNQVSISSDGAVCQYLNTFPVSSGIGQSGNATSTQPVYGSASSLSSMSFN